MGDSEKSKDQLIKELTELRRQVAGLEATRAELLDTQKSLYERELLLSAEKRRFEILAENSPFAMVIIDSDGRFTYANPKFSEILGYTLNDVPTGKDWFRKAFPDTSSRHEVIAAWLEDMRTHMHGETRPRIFEVTCKDGTEKTILFRPVKLHTGEDLMTCEDITERKNLELQLLQAQKMEAVGTLAGGIAHDFNNLLQAVLGCAEIMMLRQKPDSPDLGDLRKISAAAKRGADLVRNLLTFSRRVEPRLRVLDLNKEIREIQKLLSRTIPKTVRIVLKSRGQLNQIMADPSQVGQVLMNLAVNARDAMPDGGTLTIETENVLLDPDFCSSQPEVSPGLYVLLTVSDTGHGMDKQTCERMFDPFFSTKEVGKGTGLGLATVYGIVKGHKGHIICSSEPGRGTVFRVYLPAIDVTEHVQDVKEETEPPRGNETILLVEDEDVLRDLGKEILSTFGYEVLEAQDGRQALRIYEEHGANISLVMLDLNMPEMDGEKCMREILKKDPKARILIVTGIVDYMAMENAVTEKAVGIVTKPYNVPQLLTKLREVLDAP